MRRHSKWLKLFGIGLWVFIISRLDFQQVLEILKRVNLIWLSLAAVLLCGMFLFKSLRWQTVLRAQDISYNLIQTIRITIIASFFGLIIPGRLGDLAKLGYLKRSGISLTRGLVSVILDRMYDIVSLVVFGTVGFLFFLEFFLVPLQVIGIFSAIVGLIVLLIFFFRARINSTSKRILRYLIPASPYEKILIEGKIFQAEFNRVALPSLPPMILFSTLAYICLFTQIYAVAKGLGLTISFLFLGLSFSVASLVSLIPISIGGLGTREAVLITLFNRISLSTESAVLLSFIDITVFSVFLPGIFALIFWIGGEHE